MARVDDLARQSKVTAARRLIYKKSYFVNGAAIESLLKAESLVPTAVCMLLSPHKEIPLTERRTLSLND
jgi:hypothetical protein